MNAPNKPVSVSVRRSMGHIALHYRTAEDGPAAARLLEILGFTQVQAFPLPGGGTFYQYILDGASETGAEGILYLSPLPEPDRALMTAIRAGLGIGTDHQSPTVAAFRAAQAADPEYGFHVGVLADSLEWIETTMETFRQLNETDPAFRGRLNLLCNRARRGTPEVDARLDASPLFSTTPRYIYGYNAVQAFIDTDIFVGGPLGEKLVFELDYVFPGYPDNMFTRTVI